MDQELFNPQSSSVSSSRIIYTPSTFARTSLLHLQEVGSLQAVHPHTSTRTNFLSFLCFVVLSGKGKLKYEGVDYELRAGDCVFIDCRKAYSHSTSDNLWSLQWCHFYAPSLPAVYEKYKERGGRPVFHPDDIASFTSLLSVFFASTFSSKMQIDFLKVAWGISPVLHFPLRHSFRCRRGAVAGIQSLLVTDM